MQDVLGINWNLFELLNAPAGHEPVVDRVMVFAANGLIFFAPLLLLALWFSFSAYAPVWRDMAPAARASVADDRALGQRLALLALVAVPAALALNVALGHLIVEPRPFVSHPTLVHRLIAHAADASFPSDHEAVAAAIAAVLAIAALLIRRRERRTMPAFSVPAALARAYTWPGRLASVLAALAVLVAAVIGLARVYVGVHYPGDILGGAVCGVIGALVALALLRIAEPILAAVVAVAARLRLT